MSISMWILVIGLAVILLAIGVFALISGMVEGRDDDMQRYLNAQRRAEREAQSRTNQPEREPGMADSWRKPLAVGIVIVALITAVVNIVGLIRSESNSGDEVYDDQGNLIETYDRNLFGDITGHTEYYTDGLIRRQEDYENGVLYEAWEYADDGDTGSLESGTLTRYEDHTDSDDWECYNYDSEERVISHESYWDEVLEVTDTYEYDGNGEICRSSEYLYSDGKLYQVDTWEGDFYLLTRMEFYNYGGSQLDHYEVLLNYDNPEAGTDDADEDSLDGFLEDIFSVSEDSGDSEDDGQDEVSPSAIATFDAENNLEQLELRWDREGEPEEYAWTVNDYGIYQVITGDALKNCQVEYGDDGFAVSVTYTGE